MACLNSLTANSSPVLGWVKEKKIRQQAKGNRKNLGTENALLVARKKNISEEALAELAHEAKVVFVEELGATN